MSLSALARNLSQGYADWGADGTVGYPFVMAGLTAGNAVTKFLVDASGRLQVTAVSTSGGANEIQGTIADGAPVGTAKPVHTGGVDGSGNVQSHLTQTSGRQQVTLADGSADSGVGVLAASLSAIAGTSNPNGLAVGAGLLLHNSPGSSHDRWTANIEGTLLASAARTATTASADQTNVSARGVRVDINVTAVGAAPSITVTIQEKDPISGNYIDRLVSAAITTTGQKTSLFVYPAVTAAANVAVSEPLARKWRVNVAHANADSITYSVAYNYTQ